MAKKEKKVKEPKLRRERFKLGDRSDGYRIRTINPLNKFMPYIMPKRSDALNYFADTLDITETEKYVRQKVKEGKTNFSMLHVLLASYVRAVSQRPAINRFINGQRIYSRRDIQVVMVIKKEMSIDSPDTCIKVYFNRDDTIDQIYEKFNAVVLANTQDVNSKSSFDKVNKALLFIPGLLLRWTVKFLNLLDYFGILPKGLLKVSPFHGSMIITSMGSLGIPPIYHHIYDFGNLPIFISYGIKYSDVETDMDGTLTKRKKMDLKVVTDERICDGFYYASAFKLIKRYAEKPTLLDAPPETVIEDIP